MKPEMKAMADGIIVAVREYVEKKERDLLARIEQLEALPFEYVGIHEPQKTYRKNQFVTYGGRVWACMVDSTIQVPGTTLDWQMACNKGRDGKDAK